MRTPLLLVLFALNAACNRDKAASDEPARSDSGGTDTGDSDSGDTDSGDTDSGDTDSGDTDTGDTDTGDTDSGGTDRPVGPTEDPASSVSVFAEEYLHYGSENKRSVDVAVSMPTDVSNIRELWGRFSLTCPNGACDFWDRYGTFGLLLDDGSYLELDRFITPYRVGFSWESDLTPLLPLLQGDQTFRVFIDTWVTEGHEQGDGWLFTARLDYFEGAPPDPAPVAVIPVWPHQSWNAGLDSSPVEGQVVPTEVALPSHSQLTFRSFITGHGWNNSQNCAEFCAKDHYYTVGDAEFGTTVWREDCADTVTDGRQQGTWRYSRAGWCPGAQVYPRDTDVTEHAGGADTVTVSYRLEDFTWRGDGDQPYYYLSGVLIAWE